MADVIEIVVSQGGPQGPAGPVDSGYTDAQLAALKAGVGGSRDTLKELSDAIDASGATSRSYTDQKVATLGASVTGLRLVKGAVTKVAPGGNPDFALTGTGPVYGLDLSIVTGDAGAGAPNSADILAIHRLSRLERSLAAAGITEEASLMLDFVRGVHYASRAAIAATIVTIISAVAGVSGVSRASAASHCGSDGLLKWAAANVLREDYDPVTKAYRGLLVENDSRTNLWSYSEEFDNAAYTKARTTVTPNATTGPDGLLTADKLCEDATASSTHVLTRSITAAAASAATLSYFLKAGERTEAVIQMSNGGGSYAAIVDLVAGTITQTAAPTGDWTAGSVEIENWGNGWYRAGITATIGATANPGGTLMLRSGGSSSYTGDGVSGLYVWGAQPEIGDGWSSYIKTGVSTATRSAEFVTLAGGQWLPAGGPWTVMVEASLNRVRSGSAASIVELRDAAGTNVVKVRASTAIPGADFYTISGGSARVDTAGYALTAKTITRLAFAIDATSYAFAKDNVVSITGGASVQPAGLDRLVLGNLGFMGHIRRIIIWPQRLSDGKTQALSSQAWS